MLVLLVLLIGQQVKPCLGLSTLGCLVIIVIIVIAIGIVVVIVEIVRQ